MNWPTPMIGDVCLLTHQGDPARSGRKSFRYVDIAGVDRDSKSISRADEVQSSEAPSRARKIIEASDVLVSTVRPNLNAIALVPENLNGEIASTGFAVLRANRALLDPKYLFYWAQSTQFVDFLVANATGASYPAVTDGIVKRAPIPLASPREQSRIIELLDEADRLRRIRREADAKVARILPSLFLKMFGDPATNPMGWQMSPLGDLADQRPEYGANASACPRKFAMPRYVRITDIRDNGTLSDKEIVSLDSDDWQRYLLHDGDVLFARSGNTVGKTYIYRPDDGPCAFAGYLIRFQFRSGAVDPWFVFGVTRTAYYRGWVESHKRVAGQPNINGQEYSSLLIPEPPQPLQQNFGKMAREIEQVLTKADEGAEQFEATFSTLLVHAFSGQLTAQWREGHMQELLAEMAQQARALNLPMPKEVEALP
jgi:type I restriction enzyme S subunit